MYKIEVMLMTVIMKNICSMQKMTDEFLKEECVGYLCWVLGIQPHEFLPHYVTRNKFLAKAGHRGVGTPEETDDMRPAAEAEFRERKAPWEILDGHLRCHRPVPLPGRALPPLPEKSDK